MFVRFILSLLLCLTIGKDLPAASWLQSAVSEQQNCRFPDMAVDAAGNCVSAWIYFDGTHSHVQVATKPVMGNWSTPYTFGMAEREATSISVAMDQKGGAVAVWTSTDGKFSMVQSARLSEFEGNVWSPIQEPLTILVFMGSYPKVQFDGQGNALAAWGVYDGKQIAIEAARLPVEASSWKRMHDCTQLSKDISGFEFALDSSGNAVAVWECQQEGHPLQIYASSLASDSSQWSDPVLLSSETISSACPKIVVDQAGNAVAAWWTLGKSIKTARLPVGQKEWQGARLAKSNSPFFSLGMTPDGDALLVWEPETPGNIQYSILSKSKKAWTKPAAASRPGEEARSPLLRINGKGNAVAIWENHMLGCIQGAAMRMGNQVWTLPKTLARVQLDSTASNGRPVLGVYGSDAAVVLYPFQGIVKAVYGKELFGVKRLQAQAANYELKQLKLFKQLEKRIKLAETPK